MKAENEMTLTFPSRSSNESFARAAVACFAAQLDPNLEELNDIKTAVSEAVTNCIVHAYRDCLGTVTIRCRILPERAGYRHPRQGLRHGGCGKGPRAHVHDRRPGAQRHGIYDHGELHDLASGHVKARQGHDGTYEAQDRAAEENRLSDTITLIQRSQQGDRDASERLVTENTGLIWSIARRYFGRGVEPDDLFQLGCVGFLKAVEGFDTTYGTQFSTYAVPKIAGEIRRFLRDDGAVKVSRSVKERAAAIKKARERLTGDFGRDPTVSELSEALGLSPEEIAAAETATSATESIQRQTGEEGFSLEDVLCTDGMEEKLLERMALQEALARLNDKERLVIQLRYYHSLTQQRVAGLIGVSQVQVSRIEKKALERLRTFF